MNHLPERESISLSELNGLIGQRLKAAMPDQYWVTAEINEMHVNIRGHCFLELIEKAPLGEQITAKSSANIWAYHFRMLRPYFETMTGQSLSAGLKVMLRVSVEFHELYGMSLQVTDINPAFTVGDLAVRKMAVLQKLTDEGIIDMNRELDLPDVAQRIAVISSKTAAGYGDFIDQLHQNPYGYAFRHTLFPAVMQGNDAETSIINALDQIFEREEEFDVAVIIRGGGAQSDLNCFNSYRLTCCMAQFPLPLITGIGHDRDETIADRVACVSLKTPTAVAEFLINKALLFDKSLEELTRRLAEAVAESIRIPTDRLLQQSRRLQNITRSFVHARDKELQAYRFRLSHADHKAVQAQNAKISELLQRLFGASRTLLNDQKKQIVWSENKVRLLDPTKLLQRGYSVTLADGKIVRDIRTLEKGQCIETLLYDGKVESVVEKTMPNQSLPSSAKL